MSSVSPRRRLFPAAVPVLSVGAAIVLRLGFLQIALHGHYLERAEGNQRERVRILPARGSIRDRDGRLLAQDLRTYSLYAVPRQMKDPARMARRLARALRAKPHLALQLAVMPSPLTPLYPEPEYAEARTRAFTDAYSFSVTPCDTS